MGSIPGALLCNSISTVSFTASFLHYLTSSFSAPSFISIRAKAAGSSRLFLCRSAFMASMKPGAS